MKSKKKYRYQKSKSIPGKANLKVHLTYVILDNAAYQRCRKVKQCAESLNINLIFLLPHSPNLNLIERLWKFLCKKIMTNKYYCKFENFFETVKKFIEELCLIA